MNVVYKIVRYVDRSIAVHHVFIPIFLKITTVLKSVNLGTIILLPSDFVLLSALRHTTQYFKISLACHAKPHVSSAQIHYFVQLALMVSTSIRSNASLPALPAILITLPTISVIVVFSLVKPAHPTLIAYLVNQAI